MGKLTDEELESIDILATYNCFEKIDISKMKNLKYIQLSSTGFDQVPIEKLKIKIFYYVIIKVVIVFLFLSGLYLLFYKFIKIQNHFMINNLKNNGFVIILFLKFMAKKLDFWGLEH